MGLSCNYNVSDMPQAVQAQVGTLYRKLNDTGVQDPVNGVWTAQCDNFATATPTRITSGTSSAPTALFGPMGSLRVSVNELCQLILMFCQNDSYGGVQILKPETIERMFTNAEGDRLVTLQNLPFAGHTAEAYGLVGDMSKSSGRYSALYRWEEALLTAGAEFAQFGY